MMTSVEPRARILLAVQSALLGAISANVRAIICSWSGNSIRVRAVFDGNISEVDAESMSEVETEIMSHLPEFDVNLQSLRNDVPSRIDAMPEEVFVFRRRET